MFESVQVRWPVERQVRSENARSAHATLQRSNDSGIDACSVLSGQIALRFGADSRNKRTAVATRASSVAVLTGLQCSRESGGFQPAHQTSPAGTSWRIEVVRPITDSGCSPIPSVPSWATCDVCLPDDPGASSGLFLARRRPHRLATNRREPSPPITARPRDLWTRSGASTRREKAGSALDETVLASRHAPRKHLLGFCSRVRSAPPS